MTLSRILLAIALSVGVVSAAAGQQVPETEKYRISTGYYNQPQAPAAPAYRQPQQQLPSAHGAIAMDWSSGGTYWTTFASSDDEATGASLDACRSAGGKECRALDAFSNQCSAVAADGEGYVYQGYSVRTDHAEREAMQRCIAGGRGGFCGLKVLSVCSYYSSEGTADTSRYFNKVAAEATAEEREQQSRKFDRRDYWAAAVETSAGVFWIENQRSRDAALQKVSEKCGHGRCDPIIAWNRSCAAWAGALNESGKLVGRFYPATSAVAQTAHDDALAACREGSGAATCAVEVACSGREYAGFKWKDSAASAAQSNGRVSD